MTIFNYDENNYMKNEINNMPKKKRKNTFKLMKLVGNLKFKCNLYLESYEEEENTRIITYDKDGNKITFYPRSNNERLEELLFKKSKQDEMAYYIPSIVGDNANYLKMGHVYDFFNAKIIISKIMRETSIEFIFFDGVSYTCQIFFADFDENNFLNSLNGLSILEFSDFINLVCENTSNYFKRSNFMVFKCLGMGLEVSKVELSKEIGSQIQTLEEQESIKRILKKHNFTLNE